MPDPVEQEPQEEDQDPGSPHPGPPPQSSPVGGVGLTYLQRLQNDDTLWPEVLAKLQAGEPSRAIASWLHRVKGFVCGSTGGVANSLSDFRKSLAPAPVLVHQPTDQLTGARLLEDLTWALGLLKQRIKQSRKTEKEFPMAHSQVTQDLELYRRLCESRASLAQELALVRQAPPPPMTLPPGLGVFAQVDPQVRHEAVEAALRVLHAASARAWREQPHVRKALEAWSPRTLPPAPAPGNGGDGDAPPAPDGGTDQ